MPKYKITGPDGQSYEVNAPDGTSEQDVLAYAQRSFKMAAAPKQEKPAKPFGQQLNDAISDAPRQLGLTARYGLEGLGNTFDSLIGNPARTLARPIFGNQATADTGGALADFVGLPKPQTPQERVVGDATRTLAGGAGVLGVASKVAQGTAGATQAVARALAANPAQQLASAGAAGAAGGYARETGGNDSSQLLASLAAGVAAPAAMAGGQRLATAAARRFAPPAPTPQQVAQIDITINNALQGKGMTLEDLPAQVAQGIRNDVAAAFRTSDRVSPEAIERLADYRLTNTTPTAAGLTLDPAIVTQQKNLAKLGINSKDRVAQQLGQTQNLNNRQLTEGLNVLGAGAAEDAVGGANRIMRALGEKNDFEQSLIGGAYEQARDNAGRSAQLDNFAFTQRAGDLLHESNVESFLTPDIRNKLNGFAEGKIPLTVEIAEQFKTGIGRLQRNASDGNVRHALGLVRQALDDTPLLNLRGPAPVNGGNQILPLEGQLGDQAQNLGQDAIDAFNRARAANRQWMQTVEQTPALQAVRDGAQPDSFMRDFILGNGKGASVMGVAQLKNQIKDSPEAMQAVRDQIVGHLKSKALNGAADEVGNFSQSSYNKALRELGDRKLNLFFDKSEINQLKAIGRVASYEQFQPAGSAVNNSNTAGTAGAFLLDRIANSPLLSKIPVFGPAVQPAVQNIRVGQQASRALNVPAAIALPGRSATRELFGLGVSPAALFGTESEEERQRRLLSAGR